MMANCKSSMDMAMASFVSQGRAIMAPVYFPRLTLGWQINGLADIRAEQIAAMLEQGRDAGIDKTQHSQKTELVILGVAHVQIAICRIWQKP